MIGRVAHSWCLPSCLKRTSFSGNSGGGGEMRMLHHPRSGGADSRIFSSPLLFAIGYYAILTLAGLLMLCTFPVSLFFCLKVVHEYKRMVVFRMGRLKAGCPLGPGVCFVLPFVDEHHMIDLRTCSHDVPSQEMLTLDSVTVCVDAAVYFRTFDPIATITCITDARESTKLLAQTTLRNVLGTRTLTQIMSDREGIAQQAQQALDDGTCSWGVKVERVELKDVRLPRELTRVLAAEAEASREADARIVSAMGEMNASGALREAANRFTGSPTAIQLRYLQTLGRISTTKNSTIVIPIPMEVIRKVLRAGRKSK